MIHPNSDHFEFANHAAIQHLIVQSKCYHTKFDSLPELKALRVLSLWDFDRSQVPLFDDTGILQ